MIKNLSFLFLIGVTFWFIVLIWSMLMITLFEENEIIMLQKI